MDKNIFSQDLKIQAVPANIKDKKAKGLIIINTRVIIYLKAYDRTRFNKPMDIKLFNKPSMEKILKEVCSK